MITRMLTIVYTYPEDIYYAGVLLRTAYIATKLSKYIIVTKRRVKLGDLVRYSRIPIKTFKEIVSIRKDHVDVYKSIMENIHDNDTVIVVSRYGNGALSMRDLNKISARNLVVIVDEYGYYRELDWNINLYRYWTDMFNNPAYEAVSLIYLLYVRNVEYRVDIEQDLSNLDYGELMHIMRSILQSVESISNFYIINPRTLVFSLRHIFRKYGFIIDVVDTSVDLNHVDGKIFEKIVIEVYNYGNLTYLGSYEITFDGNILTVPVVDKSGSIRYLKFFIIPDRGKICVSPTVCVSREGEISPEESISFLF